MLQNAFSSLILTSFCLISTAYCELSFSISKCSSNDGNCIGEIFTEIIQSPDVNTELGIPKLNPYKPTNPWVLKTQGSASPMNFEAKLSNIQIYGLNKLAIEQITNVGVNEPFTKITVNIFAPTLTINSGLSIKGKIFSLQFDAEGTTEINFGNLEVDLTIDSNIEHRDGKDFIQVKAVQPKLKIGNSSIKSKFNKNSSLTDMIDKLINSNWKLILKAIEPSLKKYMSEMITAILAPILDKIAIQDFIDE